MQLTNEFEVGVPVDKAWAVLTDVERIAPCLPGAQLQEVEGDKYRGVVKVKVGPITAQYKGTATFIEKDDTAHRAVLRAEGRDTRGQGNANATVTATLGAIGQSTSVKVVTDLTITGKVAQFGRGVLADVSGKLINQFVANLERDVLSDTGNVTRPTPTTSPTSTGAEPTVVTPGVVTQGPAPHGSGGPAETGGSANGALANVPTSMTPSAPASSTTPSAPASSSAPSSVPKAPAAGPAGASPAPASAPPASTPAVRRINAPEAEPVDLFATAGSPLAKRALPVVAALAGLLLGWRLVGRRRRLKRPLSR